MFNKILVPIDKSRAAAAGLRMAIGLAAEQHARLRLVHLAQDVPVPSAKSSEMSVSELYNRLRDSGQHMLDRGLHQCTAQQVEADTKLYVGLGGRAAQMILREAQRWGADLIVMGTHGRRGLGRLAFGSNAEHVARHSDIPVLLIRAR